jgi:bifunctional non-homologous end joining protein LigD
MPLNWTQVRTGLDPMNYTLSSVPGLLRKMTAWSEYCDSERSLHDAIGRLGASKDDALAA